MTAYRFCRSDDVPLIVETYRRCNVGPDALPWQVSVEYIKRLSREFDLWTSSCMVAFEGRNPIGLLIAAKREPMANLVLHVGVHPDHRRKGHARHMMTSLQQKMAILEPTRMIAEAPMEAGNPSVAAEFLGACGYQAEATLTDYVAPHRAGGSSLPLAAPLTAPEALQAGLLDNGDDLCWQRQTRTLLDLREKAEGLAIASEQQIEAFVLYRDDHDVKNPLPFFSPNPQADQEGTAAAPSEILACGAADLERGGPLVAALLQTVAARTGRSLYLARVSADEPIAPWLPRWGFAAKQQYRRFAANASKG